MADNKSSKKIRLRVLTPTATKIDSEIDMAILRAVDGEMGVLPDHATYLCALADGVLRALDQGRERKIAVFGGVAEIRDNVLTVLTDEAHLPDEIDLDQTKEARERLEQELQEHTDDKEIQRAEILLRRMLVKAEVGDSPRHSDFDETNS